MAIVNPTLVTVSGSGTQSAVNKAINGKIRQPLQRRYENLNLHLNDNKTTYEPDDVSVITYGVDTYVTIDNEKIYVGQPVDLVNLIFLLNRIDIGWFRLTDAGSIQVVGFHDYSDILQDELSVFIVSEVIEQSNKPTVTDINKELALRQRISQQSPLQGYPNIGFDVDLNEVTYDISGAFLYTGQMWITIDNNFVFVGNATSQGNLLVLLNSLNKGIFTIENGVVTAIGNHNYGELLEAPITAAIAPIQIITIDTSGASALTNLYGISATDLSVDTSIAGNTDLYTKIAALNPKYIGFAEGDIGNFSHIVTPTGTGYNLISSEATALGIDPCSVDDGRGCIVFTREFFKEYYDMMLATGTTKSAMTLNVLRPLYTFAGALINWGTIDLASVNTEADLALAKAVANSFTIDTWQLAMNVTQSQWSALFNNPGGVEHGEAVFSKLLTHTNGTSAVSIINHLRSITPSAKIVVAVTLWDEYPGFYPNWISVLSALSIDGLIQYYDFYADTVVDYSTARDRVSQISTFFDFIKNARYNSKKTMLSHVQFEDSSPVVDTCAQGLSLAELYILMHKENVANGNILLGVTDFNLSSAFNVHDSFSLRIVYNYLEMLGELFIDGGQIIDVLFTGEAEDNTIKIGVLQGTTVKIGVVNPTANAYTQDVFNLDGSVTVDYSVKQRYSTGADPMSTTDVLVNETGVFNLRPYSFSIATKIGITPTVNFSFTKLGLQAFFTNNDGGSSWLWDFGDGTTSTLQNPQHLYLEDGDYTVTLTIDATDSGSHLVSILDGAQPFFGISINNIGTLVNNGNLEGVRGTFVATMGLKYQAYTVGSENHWTHYQSKTGYPSQTPVTTVGEGGNLDEIFFFTGNTTSGQQDVYNATGVPFFTNTVAHARSHNQPIVFIINIAHGTSAEVILFANYMIAQNVPFVFEYGNELTSGSTANVAFPSDRALTSAEYITLLNSFHSVLKPLYPQATFIVNAALRDKPSGTEKWINADIAAWAISNGIKEFSQYLWVGDRGGTPNAETNCGLYFNEAIHVLRNKLPAEGTTNSIYGDIVPRLTTYASVFNGLKMHVGQYGVSTQRSGFVAQTIMHGILLWNEIFEIIRFNDANNKFINRATFQNEDVSAVAQVTPSDSGWTINPAFTAIAGTTTYAMRVPGLAYEMLKDIPAYDGVPIFVPVSFVNAPLSVQDRLFDIICCKLGTRIMLYVYNYGSDNTINSIVSNGSIVGGTCIRKTIFADQLYGSIGNNPSYAHFTTTSGSPPINYALDNIGLQKVNVDILDGSISATAIQIKKYSIMRIELTSITDSSNIVINLPSAP